MFTIGIQGMAKVPFIIDASSIINLFNADALSIACEIHDEPLLVTPLVLGECNILCASKIFELEAAGKINLINDDDVPTDLFLEILNAYQLGDGETEVIALASQLGLPICCDDKRARNLAKQLLGIENVIGSLTLLKWSVEVDLVQCKVAYNCYQAMRNAGGFLPKLEDTFFCNNPIEC